MKHMREDIPSVRDFNPTVPQALENVIIAATVKNKTHRTKMAVDMHQALKDCLSDKHKNDPKLVFKADTLNDQTITIDQVSKMEKPQRRIGLLPALIGIGFMALVAFGIYGYILLSGIFNPAVELVTVPNVSGMTRAEAEDALLAQGINASSSIRYELTDDLATGLVVKTTPSGGSKIEKGSLVTLTLSKGMYFVVGDYINLKLTEVENALRDTKITVRIQYDFNSVAEDGTILKQEGLTAGQKIDPTVTYELKFTVAGKVSFNIPDLYGFNITIAQNQLTGLGATVELKVLDTTGMTEEQIALLSKNTVIAIDPAPGTFYTQTDKTKIVLSYYAP
jgi:serine/threonine-protein kinase